MKIFLGIIIILLVCGLFDVKTDEECKVYKVLIAVATIGLVVVFLAETAVALWL